ncbi:MAG: proA [Gammaproteobacteria bacterium]|nr:proA [Gammaproteobacteria bacterium]
MKNWREKLQNLDTAEISDALDACGIEGALLKIKPAASSVKLVGEAFTVQYAPYEAQPTEYKNAGDYIDEVPAGAVVVLDNQGREDCTTWGDILTQVSLAKGIAGTVIYGAIRDVALIRELRYPVFSKNIYMRSGKNRVHKIAQQCPLNIEGIVINPGDIIVGDDNGVLVIPRAHLDEVIQKAENIKRTEQAIINSVKNGEKLSIARKLFRYDQPWLSKDTTV